MRNKPEFITADVECTDKKSNHTANWLRVAVINTKNPYSYGDGRLLLYEFYEQLKAFVTQLYIASENQQLTNPSSHSTSGANWPISRAPGIDHVDEVS